MGTLNLINNYYLSEFRFEPVKKLHDTAHHPAVLPTIQTAFPLSHHLQAVNLEKKIAKCKEPDEKAELEKELLILQILILQREKIDKEAAVILSDSEPFGEDTEKIKEKKRKERDKKQKALLDKLNELGISNLDIEIKPPKKNDGREKGGMGRQQRIR